MSRALVLSAGGMFGAYQAGVWKALAGSFRPDLIVGASVGALNGWAIAGDCSGDELCRLWSDPETSDLMHLRFPVLPWHGIFDPQPLYRMIERFSGRFPPRVPFASTLVELPRFRQVFAHGAGMTAAHLRASCAIPFGFPPVRLDGKWHVDGGLMAAVPLRAAVELGATSAIVINALPVMPSVTIRLAVKAFRALAAPKAPFPRIEVTEIRPSEPLGSLRDAIFWKAENIRRWIALGEKDGAAALAAQSITTSS